MVMGMIGKHPNHEERMGDAKHADRLGELFHKRGDHLEKLKAVAELAHEKMPLPMSFDTSRMQPPYFNEFGYTECLGNVLIQPLSSETAARLVDYAARTPLPFDRFDVAANLPETDKYRLGDDGPDCEAVAFAPGSNIYRVCVSAELLDRAMDSDPDLMLKAHPLTVDEHMQHMGRLYGYHRLIDPDISGWACLTKAKRVYTTTSSEMGLYAFLQGKPVINITSFGYEFLGSYNSFYRLLWDRPADEAAATLRHVLNSPYSGIFHPDDPDLEAKMDLYFAKAMEFREAAKPLVREYSPIDYLRLVARYQPKVQPDAKSANQREQRSGEVAPVGPPDSGDVPAGELPRPDAGGHGPNPPRFGQRPA